MSTFHKLSSMLLPTFPWIQVNIAVFSRNRAGVKNRNHFKKNGGEMPHTIYFECELQLQNFTCLKFAFVAVWSKFKMP